MNVGVDPSKVVITKLKIDKDRKARRVPGPAQPRRRWPPAHPAASRALPPPGPRGALSAGRAHAAGCAPVAGRSAACAAFGNLNPPSCETDSPCRAPPQALLARKGKGEKGKGKFPESEVAAMADVD